MTRHYKQRSHDLSAQLVEAKVEKTQLLAKINFRPGLRNVSCFGCYSLATKRNDAGASTGAGAAAMLVAGDDFRGGLHDKKLSSDMSILQLARNVAGLNSAIWMFLRMPPFVKSQLQTLLMFALIGEMQRTKKQSITKRSTPT